MRYLIFLILLTLCGCAQPRHANRASPANAGAPASSAPAQAAPNPAVAEALRSEQIRTDCIEGRRIVCGRVLQVHPDGLVVDSGYTDLLRPPLDQSWVAPSTVSVSRNPNVLELNQPGTACIGVVFLTDIPNKPPVHKYDYVLIQAYPAGSHVYAPAPDVKKTIRKFSAGLETAVRLNLEVETNAADSPLR